MQELEKERIRRERAEGGVAEEAQDRPNIKFMISGEAPILMSKACELLIKDLSFRAWQHTERNRRRTLQRQDLHAAVGESEVYDFLIDIVPRVQAAQGQHADGGIHALHQPGGDRASPARHLRVAVPRRCGARASGRRGPVARMTPGAGGAASGRPARRRSGEAAGDRGRPGA